MYDRLRDEDEIRLRTLASIVNLTVLFAILVLGLIGLAKMGNYI